MSDKPDRAAIRLGGEAGIARSGRTAGTYEGPHIAAAAAPGSSSCSWPTIDVASPLHRRQHERQRSLDARVSRIFGNYCRNYYGPIITRHYLPYFDNETLHLHP